MQIPVEISGKPVQVTLTPRARKALETHSQPITAEMELYFSCLIRKRVLFHQTAPSPSSVPVTDKLHISFRPVMMDACEMPEKGVEVPLSDFPITKPRAYIPKWLRVDFRNGEWQGEFGYQVEH